MLDDREWTVEIRLAYTVNAASPAQALGAVLPLLSLDRDRYGPQPEIADYTVRERSAVPSPAADNAPPSGLTKSVYTAKEVAEILHISTASVYEKIPCMRIGGSRRYSRTVILEILEKGSVPDPPPLPVAIYDERQQPEKPAKVASKAQRPQKPFATVTEVARMLRLSASKVRELLDAKKIHYFETDGRRQIRRDAVEHYVAGGTPRQFVERMIADGEKAGYFKDDPESLQQVVDQWRAAWPD
jgi:excisionase family DNA binding protein